MLQLVPSLPGMLRTPAYPDSILTLSTPKLTTVDALASQPVRF